MIAVSLLMALSLPMAAPVSQAETQPGRGRLMKLIGEQVSFDPIDCIRYRWGTEDGRDDEDNEDDVQDAQSVECTEDDLHYQARYRVVQAIESDVDSTVDFLATGWTSYYAESRHALVYVPASPDAVVLPVGLAISVYPTADGDWASCDAEIGSEPLKFLGDPVFGRTDGMSPYGIAQRYPSTDYSVRGEEVFCIRGRRLPALIEELDSELDDLREGGFPYLPKAEAPPAGP